MNLRLDYEEAERIAGLKAQAHRLCADSRCQHPHFVHQWNARRYPIAAEAHGCRTEGCPCIRFIEAGGEIDQAEADALAQDQRLLDVSAELLEAAWDVINGFSDKRDLARLLSYIRDGAPLEGTS